ncbi:MAG: VOC family protein [Rhodospirillaceae bacterium]|nr:VOC family protein [Rhodospirillaceae bacterium]MDE0253562.1 VOC family protein [Rhodospirillaceae bacterium]MDE0617955.1 VOC family protein [Rhodospirillaceae bacterium]
MLNYADAPAAIDFLVRAFGFRERAVYAMKDGRIGHAELALGGNVVMLASVFPEIDQTTPNKAGGWYSQVFCYVDDVDAHHAQARAAGARITAAPEDRFYGERHYRAEDPEGHRWIFGQRIREVPEAEIRAMMDEM